MNNFISCRSEGREMDQWIKEVWWQESGERMMRREERASVGLEDLIERLEHEILDDFALELEFDFEAVLLDLVPVVRTEGEFALQHVDDLVLVLLVDALQVLLVVDDVLLVDDPAPHLQRLLQPHHAPPQHALDVPHRHRPREVHHLLPRERQSLLPARPELLQQEDHRLEDAAVEDGDRLPSNELLLARLPLAVVLGREEVLPVHEGLVRDQRVVFVLWDLEVSQKLEVLQRREALVLVEFADDILEEGVGLEEGDEGLGVVQHIVAVEGVLLRTGRRDVVLAGVAVAAVPLALPLLQPLDLVDLPQLLLLHRHLLTPLLAPLLDHLQLPYVRAVQPLLLAAEHHALPLLVDTDQLGVELVGEQGDHLLQHEPLLPLVVLRQLLGGLLGARGLDGEGEQLVGLGEGERELALLEVRTDHAPLPDALVLQPPAAEPLDVDEHLLPPPLLLPPLPPAPEAARRQVQLLFLQGDGQAGAEVAVLAQLGRVVDEGLDLLREEELLADEDLAREAAQGVGAV